MIDRVTAKLGRRLYEVPVGFKWFVGGLLDGSLGFAGEESAGASFVRRDGSVWTTDKDGMVAALLAAEITARMDRDPGEIYRELTREFGEPVYDRVEAPATPEEKARLETLSPEHIRTTDLAGERIQTILTSAPGDGNPIGGVKVVAESGWFAARPSGTEEIYKIYAESFRGADHLRRILEEAQIDRQRCAGGGTPGRRQCGSNGNQLMSNPIRVGNPAWSLLPTDIDGLDALAELALDMRWSWNHAADEVWRQLDPDLWDLTHNPWGVLQTVSRDQVERALADPDVRAKINALVQARRRAAEAPGWFQQTHAPAPPIRVAYFSMEYMLSEALPDLLGRTGQCGRRSAQGRQRSGRASRRRGAAVPAGLLSPGDRQGRRATGPLPVQRSRTVADHGGAAPERGVAAAGDRPARLLGLAARLAGPGRQGDALPAGQQ